MMSPRVFPITRGVDGFIPTFLRKEVIIREEDPCTDVGSGARCRGFHDRLREEGGSPETGRTAGYDARPGSSSGTRTGARTRASACKAGQEVVLCILI
jgi:hypothetical protein